MTTDKRSDETSSSTLADYVRTRTTEMSTAQRDKKRLELQLKMFPTWPEDRRGYPNTMARSAIFAVIRRGRREHVEDLPISAPEGTNITLTGWRLDQADCDVWLEVMHLARETKPGEPVTFTLHSMLRRLGRKGDGKNDREWLKRRLKSLMETSISYSNAEVNGGGSMLTNYRIDLTTGIAVVHTNSEMRPLFEYVTHINIERRRALGSNQLAKALHAMISSHADWLPIRVETVMHRVGASYSVLKSFRRDLKIVLRDFQERGWIENWSITSNDLVHIALYPTPTQIRSLETR